MPNTSLANIGLIRFAEQGATPSTPASTFSGVYMRSDGLYVIDDAGGVTGPLIDASGGSTASSVILAPDSLDRNLVQPTVDYHGLVLKNNGAQATTLFESRLSAGTVTTSINHRGRLKLHDISTTPPLAVTMRSSVPTNGVEGDIYLDDGTYTRTGKSAWRRRGASTWENIGELPSTTKADLVVRDNSGDDVRFPVGTNGQIIEADSTESTGIKWADKSSSGAGNPGGAPASIGDIYVDTTNDRTFIAADTSANTDYKRADSGKVIISSSDIVADAASITLSSLVLDNNEFASWELVISGMETDRAAQTNDNILITFNSDTTVANYNSVAESTNGATDTHNERVGTVSGILLHRAAAAANSDSGVFGHSKITIHQPASAGDYKHVHYGSGIGFDTSGEGSASYGSGVWKSTAAITSVTITPFTGTTFLIDPADATEPDRLSVRLYGLY